MNKRLTRNMQDKKIQGVCSGIANYLGIDPTIIRLGFAIGALFWGTTIIAYLLCWIIIPESKIINQ